MNEGEKIEIIRGDDYVDEIVFSIDGVAIDLTGWQVSFVAKDKDDVLDGDSGVLIRKTFSIFSDPTNGVMLLELDSHETNIDAGKYSYAIRTKDADGELNTVLTGELFILPNPSDGSEFS